LRIVGLLRIMNPHQPRLRPFRPQVAAFNPPTDTSSFQNVELISETADRAYE
jgi:hypothetical protein